MDVKALATNVSEFLGKHSGELRLVGSVLETIVTHLPIDQQDKTRLLGAVDTLQQASGNIAAGAERLAELANAVAGEHASADEVVIAKEDVAEAVEEYLDEHGGELGNGHAG